MQIDIANGEKLSINQHNLKMHGHSIEVRIYAEDPVTFFPSPGKITVYEEPDEEGIRIESSIVQGFDVTPFYDPTISKLIVTGNNRKETITRLHEALRNYKIEGIKTNLPMLQEVVQHEQFIKRNIMTDFIKEHYLPLVKN